MYKEVAAVVRKGFIKGLWRSITSIYNEIMVHPFLQDLTDGTLSAIVSPLNVTAPAAGNPRNKGCAAGAPPCRS